MKKIFIYLLVFLSLFSLGFSTTNDAEAYWAFDTSTGQLNDSSGNSNLLTNHGATSTTGLLNEAFSYDGGDYFSFSDLGIFTGTTDFSISTFVNLSVVDTTNHFITHLGGEVECDLRYKGPTKTFTFNYQIGGVWTTIEISDTLTTNMIYHLVATYSATSGSKLYLNGVLKDSTTTKGTFNTATSNNNIGGAKNTPSFKGVIDETSFYSKELSSTEISELYNSGAGYNPYTTTPPTPTPIPQINYVNITANEIENFDNYYFNTSIIDFYVEINQTNSNNNINISYSLDGGNETLINKLSNTYYDNPIIKVNFNNYPLSATIDSRTQFCIEQGFLSFSSYQVNSGTTSTAQWNGSEWLIATQSSILKILCTNANPLLKYLELSLTDNIYNISFFAKNNETNTTSSLYIFTIDTTPPIINIFNTTEINSYNIDWTQHFNYTDINIDTCYLIVENTTTNCSSYTFIDNGYHNVSIHVNDSAGNTIIENYTQFVNPYQYFYFYNAETLIQIGNYTFNNTFFSYTPAKIKISELGYGNKNLTFKKNGYIETTINININTTSKINNSYNISTSKIYINIYDRKTNNLINQLISLTIFNLANSTTTNGTFLINNVSFVPDTYTLQVSSVGYYTDQRTFIYDSESIVTINMYLLNETQDNAATLNIYVTDIFSNVVQNSNTKLLEYESSTNSFKDVGQCFTNSNGQCLFLIELGTKTYIVETSKEINNILYSATSSNSGETFQPIIENGVILTGQEITRNLILSVSSSLTPPNLLGLHITAPSTEKETIISQNDTTTVVNATVGFTSDNNINYELCYTIYQYSLGSEQEVYQTCVEGSSGYIPITPFNLNRDNTYKTEITIKYDDVTQIYKTFYYNSNDSIEYVLINSSFAKPILIFLWVTLLAFSLYTKKINIFVYVGLFLNTIDLILIPSLIYVTGNMLVYIILLTMLILTRKEVDEK